MSDVAGVHGLEADAGGGCVDVDVGDEILDGFDDFFEDEGFVEFGFEHVSFGIWILRILMRLVRREVFEENCSFTDLSKTFKLLEQKQTFKKCSFSTKIKQHPNGNPRRTSNLRRNRPNLGNLRCR